MDWQAVTANPENNARFAAIDIFATIGSVFSTDWCSISAVRPYPLQHPLIGVATSKFDPSSSWRFG